MDYSAMISKAFNYVKSHRYLWWLGILAALTQGGSANFFQFGGDGANFEEFLDKNQTLPTSSDILGVSTSWINGGALIIAILIAIVVTVLIIYISYSARAGIIASVNGLEAGESDWDFKRSYNHGKRYVVRLFCLYLLFSIAIFLLLLAFIVPIALLFMVEQTVTSILAIALIVIGVLALIAFVVYVAIVTPLAERRIVLDNFQIIDAIKAVNGRLKKQISNILITYLVSIALGIVYGLAIGVCMLVAGGVLFGVGFILNLVNQTLMIVYAVIASLAFLSAVLILSGMYTSFLSGFWTLAYRHIMVGDKR